MSLDASKRDELLRATGAAAAAARGELAAAGGEDRRPGDLVLLPATAGQAVEWLLAERDGGRWLLVPGDVDPWVGSADVEVGGEETGGPLVLRCRHALWADGAVLTDAVASGRVEPGRAAEAARRFRQAEAGDLSGSPLERETDLDPAYRRRDAEVAAARATVATSALAAEQRRRRGRFGGGGFGPAAGWRAAAAVLLVALAGVGWWAVELRGDLRRQAEPFVILSSNDLRVGGTGRDPEPAVLQRNDTVLTVRLVGDGDLADATYRIVVVDENDEVHLDLDLEFGAFDSATLAFPAATTPPGDYELLLVDPSTEPPTELRRYRLTVPAP